MSIELERIGAPLRPADREPAGAASVDAAEVGDRHPGLLRLLTCGSVDDGKSTVIGRLLYDTKSIYQDQWEAVHRTSLRRGDSRVDLALLTDGLRAEREQGITIDVAYRYFSTPRRSFILADTPGHVQYTRNMVTGASTADLAIILIDARQGVLEQTRRHAYIAALLGIRWLVVCVNKMDLVEWRRETFDAIRAEFLRMLERPEFAGVNVTFIPASALHGDNIVDRSTHAPWYDGPVLLEHLERVPLRPPGQAGAARFFVQWVVRPQDDLHPDFRGYAGRLASGSFAVGDEVVVLPGGRRSRITGIHLKDPITSCVAPQSVTLELEDDLDITRGDLLVTPPGPDESLDAIVSREIDTVMIWMSERPFQPGKRYLVKHGTRYVKAIPGPIEGRLDLHTLGMAGGATELGLNEIGRVSLRLASPIAHDPYARCRETGAFIVIDEASNDTVGAGLILERGTQAR